MKLEKQKKIICKNLLQINILNTFNKLEKYLENNGYKNINFNSESILAIKGSHWATLFIPGDPRRLYHKILICNDNIEFIIDTWYGLFSKADEDVFKNIALDIQEMILNKKLKDTSMQEVQYQRLKADLKMLAYLVFISLIISLVVISIFLLLHKLY